MSVELVSSPEPHYIPGYTGFCPQYKYRLGNTYGATSHKLLLDPTVSHSEKLVLSDRSIDDYQVFRPPTNEINIVDARFKYGDPVYKHPVIPGYEGHVPQLNSQLGQRYSVLATEALGSFEKQQLMNKAAKNQLVKIGKLQSGGYEPRTGEDRELTRSDFKLPLAVIRPEMTGEIRNIPIEEPPLQPPRFSTTPFFMENGNPEKYTKQGFAGHVPHTYPNFGKTNKDMTNSSLQNFTTNYRERQSTEWAPVTVNLPDPPFLIQPTQIYHKHVGLMPDYTGHVPGAVFRFGKTFGNDTKDCKRWLRGDYNI